MSRQLSPALRSLVAAVWATLPAATQAALTGVAVVECDLHELPDRLGDAGDGLIRLRADLATHPAAKAIIAHELCHEADHHDVLFRARPESRALLEAIADLQASAWGYPVPRR